LSCSPSTGSRLLIGDVNAQHFFAFTIPSLNNGSNTSISIELLSQTPPTIAALGLAIQYFRDTGAAAVPLPIFLLVAHFPNRTCAELAKLEEMSLSTMSRHLLVLGHGSLAVIQTRAEAGDARYVRHNLTQKGLALVQKMTGAALTTSIKRAGEAASCPS
jgi:hypothetical protein